MDTKCGPQNGRQNRHPNRYKTYPKMDAKLGTKTYPKMHTKMDPQMDAQMGPKMNSEIDAKTGTPNGPQNELEKTTLSCSPNGVFDLVSKLGGRKAQILERAGCYFTASDLCNFASSSCSCLLLLSPTICNFRLFRYLLLFPALSCYLLIFLAISLLLVVISCHLLLRNGGPFPHIGYERTGERSPTERTGDRSPHSVYERTGERSPTLVMSARGTVPPHWL
jgi:hypothetical protein